MPAGPRPVRGRAATPTDVDGHRWAARPVLSAVVRVVVLAVPFAAVVAVTVLLRRLLPVGWPLWAHVGVLLAAGVASLCPGAAPVPLFNGRTLDGWLQIENNATILSAGGIVDPQPSSPSSPPA